MLDRSREVPDRLIGVAVGDAFADSVLQVSLENDLPSFVERALGGVNLQENVFAGHVFVDHFVDGRHLSDDFLEAAVKIGGIHALTHRADSKREKGKLSQYGTAQALVECAAAVTPRKA